MIKSRYFFALHRFFLGGDDLEKSKGMRLPARASIFYFVGTFLSKGIGLLVTPLFTRAMSLSEYGVYSYYISVLGIGTMLSGVFLSPSVIYSGLGKFRGKEKSVADLSIALTFAINLLFCIVLFTFSGFFGINRRLVPIMLFQGFCDSVITAELLRLKFSYSYGRVLGINLCSSLFSAALSLLLVFYTDLGALGRILGLLFPALIITIFIVFSRKEGFLTDKDIQNFLIKNSLPLLPSLIARAALGSGDKLIIRRLMGEAALAKYSVAHGVGMALFGIIAAICSALNPWLVRKLSRGEEDATFSLISELSKIVGWGSVFALGLAPEIFAFLAPKSYADSLYAIAPFALSSLPYFLIGITTVILCYREKTKYVSASSILGAAVNIAANFLLIPYLGYAGGAIAYLVSQMLAFMLSVLWLRRYDSAAAEALGVFPTMLYTCGFGALLVLLYPYTALRILLLIIPAIFCLRGGFSALRMAKEK